MSIINLYLSLDKKEEFVNAVIENAKLHKVLNGITKNYSYEGGFDLPLDDLWILNAPSQNYNLYNSRQLRFVIQNDKILGLRFKDDIKFWSNIEIKQLQLLILDVLKKLD
jgi:hypothetical protein